mgnify:CR=1 FL=1
MNLQEHIRRVLKESKFFHRRIDLDEVKKLLPINSRQIFHETKSFKQFKPEVEIFTYPAHHGFNCNHRKQYNEVSARVALDRTIKFFENNLD